MNRFHQENSHPESDQPQRPRALRSFNDTSKNRGSSRPKFRPNFKVYLLILVVISLVFLVGMFTVLHYNGQYEVPPVSQKPVTSSSSSTSSSTFTSSSHSIQIKVPDLLNAHLNALGGRQALQDVRSVRYEGKVNFTSGQSDFQTLVLSPDKGMLVTNPGEAGGQKLMLNGDIAWRVIEQQDGSREVLRLEDESMESLKWSLRVHNTLRHLALEGQYSGLSVKEIEFMDKPCYELTKKMPDGSDFLAILEKETLYLLKMMETLRVGDAQNEFTIMFDDYRMVSGVVEPYQTTLYKNGDLDNEVEIGSIQVNSGVISSLFQVPDELLN